MQRKHMGEKISGTGLLQGVNQPRHETELQIRTGEGKYRIFAERNAPASLNLMGGHRRHFAFYGCGACRMVVARFYRHPDESPAPSIICR